MKELFKLLSNVYNFFNEKRFIYDEVPKGIQDAVKRAEEAKKETGKMDEPGAEKRLSPEKTAESKVAQTEKAEEINKRHLDEGNGALKDIKKYLRDPDALDPFTQKILNLGEKILADKNNSHRFLDYRNLMVQISGFFQLARMKALRDKKTVVRFDDLKPEIEKTMKRSENLLATRAAETPKEMLASNPRRKKIR